MFGNVSPLPVKSHVGIVGMPGLPKLVSEGKITIFDYGPGSRHVVGAISAQERLAVVPAADNNREDEGGNHHRNKTGKGLS